MQTPLSSASFAPLVALDEGGGGEAGGEGGGEGGGAGGGGGEDGEGGEEGGDGVRSFDPSVVMAKAYQKDKKGEKEHQVCCYFGIFFEWGGGIQMSVFLFSLGGGGVSRCL